MSSNRKKQRQKGPARQLNAWFRDRHPILKFLLGFIGCMLLFYLFYYSPIYKGYLEAPFLNAQAQVSSFLLRLLGFSTTVADETISGSEFSVNIKSGCDGLEAMAIFVSGILIFPATIRQKVTGALWGIGILLFLNFLRIAGLYLAGLYFSPEVFDVLHIQGGFILFTMISVLLWFIWMNWSSKTPKDAVPS